MKGYLSLLGCATVTVGLLGATQAVQGGSLSGTTATNTYAPSGFAGGAFYEPASYLQNPSGSVSGAQNAQASFNGSPIGGLPDRKVKFAGVFEYDINSASGYSDIEANPDSPYQYNFSWTVNFDSGDGVQSPEVGFSGSVVATLNEFRAGWVTDGNGNHFASALYPDSGEGIFAWATEDGLSSSDTWWHNLDSAGENRYDVDEPNSAFIMTRGSINIESAAVPTPGAALGGLLLMGGVSLRRRARAQPTAGLA